MPTNPKPTTPAQTPETPRLLTAVAETPRSLTSTAETPRSLTPMVETPRRGVSTDADGEGEPWLNAVRQATTEAMLAASGLPAVSQQRLAAQRYQTPAALQQAIEAERSYLASLSENQVIQLPGQAPRSAHLSGMRTPLERIELALDAMLNGVRPPQEIQPLTGIRELYHLLSGDYEMTGQFQAERVQFAAVTSSTMANLVANALNKRVINEFQQYPRWWEPVVLAEDFASLQNIKWITLGGVGELPTVSEARLTAS